MLRHLLAQNSSAVADHSAGSSHRRKVLAAIFKGQRGGAWEGVAGMIGEFLPSKTVRIDITGGETPHVTVDGIADITMERLKTEDGKQAVMLNAPLSAGFGVDTHGAGHGQRQGVGSGPPPVGDTRQRCGSPFDWSF